MKLIAPSIAILMMLAACGGGGTEVENLDELGALLEEQDIDCSGLENDSDEMFVREGGSCEEDILVYVFNDSENRDNYLDIASEFGGGPYVVGENWVVEMPDTSSADELAEGLDAEVR